MPANANKTNAFILTRRFRLQPPTFCRAWCKQKRSISRDDECYYPRRRHVKPHQRTSATPRRDNSARNTDLFSHTKWGKKNTFVSLDAREEPSAQPPGWYPLPSPGSRSPARARMACARSLPSLIPLYLRALSACQRSAKRLGRQGKHEIAPRRRLGFNGLTTCCELPGCSYAW